MALSFSHIIKVSLFPCFDRWNPRFRDINSHDIVSRIVVEMTSKERIALYSAIAFLAIGVLIAASIGFKTPFGITSLSTTSLTLVVTTLLWARALFNSHALIESPNREFRKKFALSGLKLVMEKLMHDEITAEDTERNVSGIFGKIHLM